VRLIWFIVLTFIIILLITAKADDIKDLISDGIKARVWKYGWKPDIRGEFQIYLQEKIKNILKKTKIAKEKARLRKDLESCGALFESSNRVHFS